MLSLSYTYRSEVTQRELPNGVHQGVVSVARGTSAEAVARAVARDVEKLGGKFAPAEVAGVRDGGNDIHVARSRSLARDGRVEVAHLAHLRPSRRVHVARVGTIRAAVMVAGAG